MQAASNIFLICFNYLFLFSFTECIQNERPIIGIVAQETHSYSKSYQFGRSLIVASYVKFLEASGARVVPIMINQPQSYYETLLSRINGVLFPGGGSELNGEGYGRTGKIIYDIAIKLNDKNDYFPLWGTCLGFELLNYLVAGQRNWMKACEAYDIANNLNFATDVSTSKLYKGAEGSLIRIMSSENVTINYHNWCITPQNFTAAGLDQFLKVLTVNKDSNNMSYISSVESYKYPFYGVAFHPEKVLFEWTLIEKEHNIPHTDDAVKVSHYFSRFFVSETRKSMHRFPSKNDEDSALIYNFQPLFTGKLNMTTVQNYYFS